MSKPKVDTNPVANNYAAPNERIVEYSSKNGGGLISFRLTEDGKLRVDLYQHDDSVEIVIGKPVEGSVRPVNQPAKAAKVFGMLVNMPPTSWGLNTRTARVVVAVSSRAKAVEAFKAAGLRQLTISQLANYGGVTRNDVEIEVASSEPGAVFYAEDQGGRTFNDFRKAQVQA